MRVKSKTSKVKDFIKYLFRYFFVTANVLSALLLIVAAYSDIVSPAVSLIFPYLGLVFPFICLLNISFFIYWLALRQWKFMLIGVVSFFICWNSMRTYFPLHFRKDIVKTEDVIKVLTYNVMAFATKDHTAESPNQILQYIADSGADIVCMQEYFAFKSGKRLTRAKIDEVLNMYPHRKVLDLQGSGWGVAVYSKFPITGSRLIGYESETNGSSIHELDINGKAVTLVNNHLESFKLTMEDKTRYSDFLKGMGPETFDGLLRGTIQQKLGPAYLIRAKQAEVVAKEIQKAKTDYILVCGDFNDTPISYAHRTIQGPLADAFAESGRGVGVTYNQNYFWFRIDHILHSSNMESFNCTVDKVKYSDHYPVWCYLKLN